METLFARIHAPYAPMAWDECMTVTSSTVLQGDVDPTDDLSREVALYISFSLAMLLRREPLADTSPARSLATSSPSSLPRGRVLSASRTGFPSLGRTTITPRWSSRTPTWSASGRSFSTRRASRRPLSSVCLPACRLTSSFPPSQLRHQEVRGRPSPARPQEVRQEGSGCEAPGAGGREEGPWRQAQEPQAKCVSCLDSFLPWRELVETDTLPSSSSERKDGEGAEEDFDVKLEDALSNRPDKAARGGARGGRGGRGDSKVSMRRSVSQEGKPALIVRSLSQMSRRGRDAKFGFGGGDKRSKSNTRESTEDMFGGGGRGRGGGRGGRGGRGGARGGGGRGGGGGGGAKRPGKGKRVAGK